MASEAKTGRAIRLGSKVCPSSSLLNGRPSSSRLAAVEVFDIVDTKQTIGPVLRYSYVGQGSVRESECTGQSQAGPTVHSGDLSEEFSCMLW